MSLRKRLVVGVATALVGFVNTAAPAAVIASTPAVGIHTSAGSSANFSRFADDFSFPQVNIFLSDSTDTSLPQSGGPTSTRQTNLSVSVYSGDDFLECFVQNPTTFVLSSDLSAASVHMDITDATEGCSFSPSLTFPQTVDVTWTGTGTVNSFHSTGLSSCPGFNIETRFANSNRNASATAIITPMLADAVTPTQASMGSGTSRTQIEGTFPPLCEATGGGKGAGPGPVGPGTFRTSGSGAAQQLSNIETGEPLEVQAGTTTFSSRPRAGAATTTSETTVSVRTFTPPFGRGCWIISPHALTVNQNATAATLHVTVTDDTPACNGPEPNTISGSLTIDAVWTGIGPVTSTQTNFQSTCGSYRNVLSASSINNNTSAVATLSGAIEGSFASHQSEFESTGGMSTFDQTVQVQGSPSSCGL